MENTKAIEVRQRDGKTFYVMTDPAAFRDGVGRLLGRGPADQGAGRLRGGEDSSSRPTACTSIRSCATRSSRASNGSTCRRTTGFVMPRLQAVQSSSGDITDVTISYPLDLTKQMLEYSALDAAPQVVDRACARGLLLRRAGRRALLRSGGGANATGDPRGGRAARAGAAGRGARSSAASEAGMPKPSVWRCARSDGSSGPRSSCRSFRRSRPGFRKFALKRRRPSARRRPDGSRRRRRRPASRSRRSSAL